MLISIHFPFSDSRLFIEKDTGSLSRPTWPSPQADKEFVRFFGAIRNRYSSGIKGWSGEDLFCKADKSIRLRETLDMSLGDPGIKLRSKVLFKRLHFDGLAAGQYNIGFGVGISRKTQSFKDYFYYAPRACTDFQRFKLELSDFFKYMFGTPVVNRHQSEVFFYRLLGLKLALKNKCVYDKEFDLIEVGDKLRKLYLYSSTKSSKKSLLGENDWWIEDGKPIIIIQCSYDDEIRLPFAKKSVELPSQSLAKLAHYFLPTQSYNIPIWLIQVQNSEFRKSREKSISVCRDLRLYLSRLHVEHEVLKIILRNIETDKIFVEKESMASEMLQKYLNESTRRISRYEKRCGDKFDSAEIADYAKASEDSIYPGRKESVLALLEKMSIRKNIFKKIDKYLVSDQCINIMPGGQLSMENRSNYYAHQVGAQGEYASSHGNTFLNISDGEPVNFQSLSEELSILRSKLRDEATEVEHDVSIGAIAQAETYAKQNDQRNTFKSLAHAGRWSLDVATKIGTTVAAKALSIALGLEN